MTCIKSDWKFFNKSAHSLTAPVTHRVRRLPATFAPGAVSRWAQPKDRRMSKKPGESPRTPMKHVLLNKLVGREAGVIWKGFPNHQHYQLIDLCAGNGHGELSSPVVLSKHAKFLDSKGGRVSLTFVERHATTYRELMKWIEESDARNCRSFNCDSTEISNSDLWIGCDFAFILNDPNTIIDFALTKDILDAAPTFTTTLSTLGCNPSGIKRIGREEERSGWFDHVNRVVEFLPRHHEAMLVKLNADAQQWAYLVTGPKKWFDQKLYQNDAEAAFKTWTPGIEILLAKRNPDAFRDVCRVLFLTKKEMANDTK